MIENGIFIINGIECVIVFQLYCFLGVFFDYDCGKIYSFGKLLYFVWIIFYCGFWLDFEFDLKDCVFVCIDCCCKLLVLVLLCVFGYSIEEIFNVFYVINVFYIKGEILNLELVLQCLCGEVVSIDIKDGSGKVIVEQGCCIIVCYINQLEKVGVSQLEVLFDYLIGCIIVKVIVYLVIGEIIVECNIELIFDFLVKVVKVQVVCIEILYINDIDCGLFIFDILKIDNISNQLEVLVEIYWMMCLGELLIKEVVEILFGNLFFSVECYDLLVVGWMKFNCCIGCIEIEGLGVLSKEDIIDVFKIFVDICNGKGIVDDIDYLGNCCVCCVGEMVENQFCVGLVCVECVVKECFFMVESEGLMLQDLINVKLVVVVIKEFFGLSQLLQFMDQNNLFFEIIYKCCVFVFGLGGLICECVGFEVCDVYLIYYGCVCLIEIFEGLNIGLINFLVIYVCINKYGFFESLYCVVKDSLVIDEIVFLLVIEEVDYVIVQVLVIFNEKG